MPSNQDDYSNDRLVDAGKLAGYRYDGSCASGSTGNSEQMFAGRLVYQSFSTGVSMYFSDMTSLTESEHVGVLDRSWTAAINLGSQDMSIGLSDSKDLVVAPSGVQVVAVSDQLPMASRVRAGQRGRCLLLTLAPGLVTDCELAEAIETATSGTRFTSALTTPRLHFLAEELAAPGSSSPVEKLLNESRALELVAHILDQTHRKPITRPGNLARRDLIALEKVRASIHESPFQDFTLQQLASDAGMSLSSLKHKFPKAFGQTVFAYLRGIRLDYARDRIVNDGWTVSQAANFIGYRHVGNFSKAFRARFGTTPLEIRRR